MQVLWSNAFGIASASGVEVVCPYVLQTSLCLADASEPVPGREHRATLRWHMFYAADGNLEILGKWRKEQ